MYLGKIIDGLKLHELQQTPIGKELRTIADNATTTVALSTNTLESLKIHVNNGLRGLYARFPLKERQLYLGLVFGVGRYFLNNTKKQSVGGYILDTTYLAQAGAFTEDIVFITDIFNATTGDKIPLNDLGNPLSIFTNDSVVLRIPNYLTSAGTILKINYRAFPAVWIGLESGSPLLGMFAVFRFDGAGFEKIFWAATGADPLVGAVTGSSWSLTQVIGTYDGVAGVVHWVFVNNTGIYALTLEIDLVGTALTFVGTASDEPGGLAPTYTFSNGNKFLFLNFGQAGVGSGTTFKFKADTVGGPPPPPPTDNILGTIATTSVLIVNGAAGTGTIEIAGDQDWFRISLTSGVQCLFALSNAGNLNPLLRLLDATGNLIASNDDSNGSTGSLILYTPSISGDFYLSAQGSGTSTGNYSMTAKTITTPTLIVNGAAATGAISVASEQDWFRVSLTAGTAYQFTLTGNGGFDTVLRLLDPALTQLVYNDDFPGLGVNSRIIYTPSVSGDYYLSAEGFSTNVGTYSLTATA